MDLKKGLDDISQKLRDLPKNFKQQPRNNQIAWACLVLGIILILIALLIW